MVAKDSSFGFMEQENLIEIPFFQRTYVWGEDEWEQLFEDLKTSFDNKKEHFLGSIILKQLPTNAGEGTKRSLIDGQQRLTTFSILVKSLYDKLENDDRGDYTKLLFKIPTKEKIPKIKHSKIDKDSFNKILQAKNYKELVETNKKSNTNKTGKQPKNKLFACYEYFSEKIQQNIENHKDFLDFIFNSKLWVTINLDITEDEQKIFDSINTTGIKLNATDIVKNAIFAKAIELKTNYNKLYEEYWESMFESKNGKDFWEKELSTGRVKRAQSEIFLHAFAIIQGFFNIEKHNLENLSAIYKEKIKDFNPENLESFLKEIKEYAAIYQSFPQINNNTPLSFEDDEKRLFHILKITDTNTIMPLILKLKYTFKNDDILKSCFYLLERFIVMRWTCAESTKEYNKLFANTTQKFDKSNPLDFLKNQLNSIPKDNDIKESLAYLSNKGGSLILFWIELYRRYKNQSKQDTIELSYQYTLEHLMPQSWEKNWRDIAEDKEHANDLIFQIGNMTLLKGSLNSAIKNASWKTKLNGDGSRKNSIKTCADLLITKEILDNKVWNEKCIRERTERFTKEFFEIWNKAI